MLKARILVIEEEPAVQAMLAEGLKRRGHNVSVARDWVDGLRVLEEEKPDIVLTDLTMSGNRGIEVLREIRAIASETKVIVMTGHGNEEGAIQALRRGAIDYLKKPVAFWELYDVVNKIIGIQQFDINKEFVLEESKKVVMGSQIDKIWGVVNQLLLCAENICGKAKIREVGLGLYEIIINAIEHGNLEITFEEKWQALERGDYEELLRERLSNPAFSERQVVIDYQMIPGELHCVVRDEGKGFNWRHVPYPDPPNRLLLPCGRGIFLARIYLDRVEFNEKGNVVRLVKYGNEEGGGHGHETRQPNQHG
jgi:DNA-binding response OmpR family regulator